MPTEAQLQDMVDKQEIYELLCRYCRGVDRLDRELVLSCFVPGATDIHLGSGGKLYTGTIEEFLDGEWDVWREQVGGSQHHLLNFLCEVKGDQAIAETYQFSFYWGHDHTDPERNFTNSNRYIDRFERRDGEWKIAHRELWRNFTRKETRPGEFPDEHNGWLRPRQDREDPAYRTL